ncbi:glycerol-3-phosphate dehydrogenase [Halogeometricum borinquense DSM 11551]|uniref:Glycerol-3-phosphate dehydrogenase n=1 Tax=Halogeometricum borinquense (strain ATCC 700274 / DSM 11551 / JCM 10706 / KCTC 4070 / PR3) TaxID=469382 RepID=E4NLP9_HALBP|nr:FAD-dependent oxidoreductase [Halogeometricum borinquense]ADQ67252.1 glycerol-3-phosphate dehydrogenase [Halogeometricum borinquense DSM 11551]ELY25027.1 glycerol-3-phosphate dehydrogenase [Halogeometricum borinquense DSM 11551]
MADDTDVVVIGGGATGAGIVRDLALRGVDVTLVERGGLSAGTSGRSHGLLHSGARYAEADEVGARECIAENRILRDIAGECVRDTGGLFLQLAEDDPEYFEAKRTACEDIGIPIETLSGDEVRNEISGLSEAVERAMKVPDAVVSPSRLVAANAADARDHGATILTNAPVEDLHVEDGRITGVKVGGSVGETIAAKQVVNAAGAWAEDVGRMAGVEVAMRPTKGVMVSVQYDGLGPVLNRARDPADGDIVVPHDGEVVLGTTSIEVDDPDDYPEDAQEVERMVEECSKMLPPAREAERVRTWWGVRPLYAPDEDSREGARGISRGFFCVDHGDDGVENFTSIVGGKLTTYRQMAEATTDRVCEKLGVAADCRTAAKRLPGADDPEQLDAYVTEFGGAGPTDEDVVRG